MSKPFKSAHKAFSFRHKLEDGHYKGISILQEYYGKKLKTSNIHKKQLIRHKLEFLDIVKRSQFYTTNNKMRLNRMRQEYLDDKNIEKRHTRKPHKQW